MPILGVAGDVVARNKKKPSEPGAFRYKKRLSKSQSKKVRNVRRQVYEASRKRLREERKKRPLEPGGRLCDYQLYALALEEGRYYVGMTSYADAIKRFNEHAAGGKRGAMWTKKYHPLRIIEVRKIGRMRQSEAARLENDLTLEYMKRYGTTLVRGGDMCSLNDMIVATKFQLHIKQRATPFVDYYQESLGNWYRNNF